jgi:hypothetical protein
MSAFRQENGDVYVSSVKLNSTETPFGQEFQIIREDLPTLLQVVLTALRTSGDDETCDIAAKICRAHLGNVRWATRAQQSHNLRITKLTEAKVRTIRKLAPKTQLKNLAARFGVSPSLVSMVVNRKIWRDV